MNDLDLPAIADGQAAGQWLTSNDADAALGNALQDIYTVDFSAGNVTLTSAQFRSAMTFIPSGLSATRALTLPAVKRALFFVHNTDATDAITVTKGATTVSVAAGKLGAFYTDGTTDGLIGAIVTPGLAGTGDVVGPASAAADHIALYNGTTGKLIKDSGVAISTDGTLASNSDAKVTTEKGVKTYVDGKVAGLSWKQAVRAASTAAVTLATAFENGDTIDGVTLATGDRILIKNQSSGSENGIYTVNASGAPTRATDADAGAELVNASVYVSEGTANADTQWTCTTNAPITVGSTSLAFAQLTSGGGSAITAKDEGSTLTTGMTSIDFVGAGVVATNSSGDVTVTISGGGGTTKPFICFKPIDNEPPTSNYATPDTRNNHPVLEFDTTTQEAAIFSGVLPVAYAGGGLTCEVYFAADTATSGTIGWDAAIERIDASSLDIDADSFASAQTITAATVPGTSGQILKSSVAFTSGAQMDSLAAGEAFRLKIRRDVANDTAAGDAQLLRVVVRET